MAIFTFTSAAPLTIRDLINIGSLINPAGLGGHLVQNVAVRLIGLDANRMSDLDVVLSHTSGDQRNFLFLSDAGAGAGLEQIFGESLAFSDAATQTFPGSGAFITSGRYLPTANDPGELAADFGLTSPLQVAGPSGTAGFASVFGGQAASGPWSLIIRDDTVDDFLNGTLAGWSLSVRTDRNSVTLAGLGGADSLVVLSTSATEGSYVVNGAPIAQYSGVRGFSISGGAEMT